MPHYEYQCPEGHITEELRIVEFRNCPITCHCGLEARRKFSVFNWSFGWRLSDDSHIRGNPDEFVRNI